MADLHALALVARRGTARVGLPEPTATPLGAALARVTCDTPEATLLARAALAGLHAEAGRSPARPSVPAPRFTPREAPVAHAPAALTSLMPSLAELPAVAREALALLGASGLHLSAVQALPLLPVEERGEPLPLWSVLDEHARWLVGLHPDWKRHDPDLAPPALRLARQRREWTDAHAADPAGTVQMLLAAWPTLKADERRAALKAVAHSLTPEDRPLLDLARSNRVAYLRTWAAGLDANLPGPFADEVTAALRAHLQPGRNGKLKVTDGDIPAALGRPDRYETGTMLLLRALSVENAARTLGLVPTDLVEVLGHHKGPPLLSALAASAVLNGASLDVLHALAARGQPVALGGLPTAHRRALLEEAVARLLGAPAPDHTLAEIVDLLLGVGTDLPEAQAGALAAHLLREFVRYANQPRPPHLNLLARLAVHLDPFAPLPPVPDLPPVDERTIVTAGQRERLAENREAFVRTVTAAHADLAHTLDLRRRVRESLKETP